MLHALFFGNFLGGQNNSLSHNRGRDPQVVLFSEVFLPFKSPFRPAILFLFSQVILWETPAGGSYISGLHPLKLVCRFIAS